MEATQTYNKDYEDAIKTVDEFLESVKNSLYDLKVYSNYDTSELINLYNILRFEILTDKRVKELCDEGIIDEYVRKLNMFSSTIKDLSSYLIDNQTSLFSRELKDDALRTNEPKRNPKKPINVKASIAAFISAFAIMLPAVGGVMGIKKTFSSPSVPLTIKEYSVDSNGNLTSTDKNQIEFNDRTIIKEFSPTDLKWRVLRTYNINHIEITDGEELDHLNLKSVKPEKVEIVAARDYPDIPDTLYRVCNYEVHNKEEYDNQFRYDGLNIMTSVMLLSLSLLVFLGYFANNLDLENSDKNIFVVTKKMYENMISLSAYKAELKKYNKELDLNDKEIKKYQKIINTICNSIDRTIVKSVEELSDIEQLRQIKKEKELKEANSKFKELKAEEDKKREETINSISAILETLNQQILLLGSLRSGESEKIYHSVSITDDLLFEIVDNHKEIRSIFIPMLKFLDLKEIIWDNVKCSNIDFSETNAVLNIQTVYNKDISFSRFNNRNIPDWSSYKGVNIIGATLEEYPSTLLDINEAIMDESTVIRR